MSETAPNSTKLLYVMAHLLKILLRRRLSPSDVDIVFRLTPLHVHRFDVT